MNVFEAYLLSFYLLATLLVCGATSTPASLFGLRGSSGRGYERDEGIGAQSTSIDEEYFIVEPVVIGTRAFDEVYENSDEEIESPRLRRALINDFKRSLPETGRYSRALRHRIAKANAKKSLLNDFKRARLNDFKRATLNDFKRATLNDFKRSTLYNFKRINGDDEWATSWQRDQWGPYKRARA